MTRRDFTILVIAIACGVAAFVMALNLLKQAAQPTSRFVIAARTLAAGEVIGREDVMLSEPLKGVAPEELFLQVADAVGSETLKEIPKGELIYRSQAEQRKTSILPPEPPKPSRTSLPVPPGMKALTLSLRDVEVFPSSIKVGDYIDIIGRVPIYPGKLQTRTILRGAQILSLDRQLDTQVQSLTIALTSGEAETVTGAISHGKLHLVMNSEETERQGEKVF